MSLSAAHHAMECKWAGFVSWGWVGGGVGHGRCSSFGDASTVLACCLLPQGAAVLFMPRLPESYAVWMGALKSPAEMAAKWVMGVCTSAGGGGGKRREGRVGRYGPFLFRGWGKGCGARGPGRRHKRKPGPGQGDGRSTVPRPRRAFRCIPAAVQPSSPGPLPALPPPFPAPPAPCPRAGLQRSPLGGRPGPREHDGQPLLAPCNTHSTSNRPCITQPELTRSSRPCPPPPPPPTCA